MTVDEIMQAIDKLSPEEREILRREVGASLTKPETQDVTPETAAALHQVQRSSHDERGLPVEDVVCDPKEEA